MNKKFSCPRCNTKIPFKETFNFKKSHVTKCANCGAKLVPRSVKSWNFGFFVGFAGVIIPAFLILHLFNNFPLAVFIGIANGVFSISMVAYFTYLTTEFKELD